MARHRGSLRLRLLVGTLAAVAVIWLVLALVAWREAKHEAEKVFDAHLAQVAGVLQAYAGGEPDEIAEHLPNLRYARRVAFQFQTPVGRVLVRSPSAPEEALSATREGFSNSNAGGRQWRVFSLEDPEHEVVVQVAEALAARDEVSDELASHLLQPLAIALPALALALALLIGRGLRPLRQLTQHIAARRPEDLAPLPGAEQPAELQPLVERLNQLFVRVGTSLDQERRFTADAAHELRTPLAAIRAHAQVAAAEADVEARQAALAKVIAATDRATRLTEQLLTLARLDADAWDRQRRACALRPLAAEVLADAGPAALARHVQLELQDGPDLAVAGDPDLLRILVRNLVDNAVRHTPAGGLVSVACQESSTGVRLTVTDTGPGIPAAERTCVTERFRRLPGAPEGGAGLGLSIATRIASLHGARLELADGPGGVGLAVLVIFAS